MKKLWSKLKEFAKKNIALLITIGFSILFLILWLYFAEEILLEDLWVNLLAGFIASICTITVIDNILKKQIEKDNLPLKLAMYRDVQLFVSRLISLWQEMYVQSVVLEKKLLISELFTSENINKIYTQLDLEGFPNVTPRQNWFNYIDNAQRDLCERGFGHGYI